MAQLSISQQEIQIERIKIGAGFSCIFIAGSLLNQLAGSHPLFGQPMFSALTLISQLLQYLALAYLVYQIVSKRQLWQFKMAIQAGESQLIGSHAPAFNDEYLRQVYLKACTNSFHLTAYPLVCVALLHSSKASWLTPLQAVTPLPVMLPLLACIAMAAVYQSLRQTLSVTCDE